MASKLTIGKLANLANVNVETVRYYQRVDLIQEPEKPISGFRIYNEAAVDRIRFIKKAQRFGFSLSEIRELLLLGDGHCSDVRELAEEKRNLVEEQISDLMAVRDELNKLIASCHLTEATPRCALIDSIIPSNKDH